MFISNIFKLLIISALFIVVKGSIGDSSPYYQRCVEKCSLVNCTTGKFKKVRLCNYRNLYKKIDF